MPKSGVSAFLIKELKEVLPPTVFFAVSFNLLVLTIDLVLADYVRTFFSFLVATTTALVVGKSVLLADTLPLLRRFNTAPMIQTVLFKTSIYWAVVFLVRFGKIFFARRLPESNLTAPVADTRTRRA